MKLIEDDRIHVGQEARRSDGSPRARSRLNEQTQRRLSTHLRALYQSVLDQPVPEKFKDVIARLEDRQHE